MPLNKKLNKFGTFIRELRLKKGIGQRNLAEKIGIAASYLNDIEKNKRTAPKINIINKLSTVLETDKNHLHDLAGFSKKGVAPDISEYIESNPKIISLIRKIIKDSKKTAITITHDIKLAMLLASKIILIDEGKVEWSGNPNEAMLSKNKLVKIFLNG